MPSTIIVLVVTASASQGKISLVPRVRGASRLRCARLTFLWGLPPNPGSCPVDLLSASLGFRTLTRAVSSGGEDLAGVEQAFRIERAFQPHLQVDELLGLFEREVGSFQNADAVFPREG